MGELFGEMGSGFRVSMKDSIVMDILHSAMNKAHERLKSKEGLLERLIETSKFYELAVMELEGCLRIVQVETDSFPLETKHEQLLSELFLMKNRLQGRLEETELSILNKDRELLENESILKQALELKERELISFHEDREGEICELKSSIERKVSSFKQKFLDDYDLVDEKMSSDIDNLKETLDLAFEKMQAAIFSCEIEPIEQRWKLDIEKDVFCTVTKGFVQVCRKRIHNDSKRHGRVDFLATNWSDLISEATSLRNELKPIGCKSEVTKEKKKDQPDAPLGIDDKKDDDESRFVAKMVKNHESIIRQKSEEMKWLLLKGEIMQDKGYSSLKKESDLNGLRVKIQKVTEKLDNLINWDNKNLPDDKYCCDEPVTPDEEAVTQDSNAINDNLHNHVKKLKEELEESNLLTVILDDTYAVICNGMMRNFYTKLQDLEIDTCVYDEVNRVVQAETIETTINSANSALRQYVAEHDHVSDVREDIYNFIIVEAIKDAISVFYDSKAQLGNEIVKVNDDEEEEERLAVMLELLLDRHEYKESDNWIVSDNFSPEEESCFGSIHSKLEKALQQLNVSRVLLGELASSFVTEVTNREENRPSRELVHRHEKEEIKIDDTDILMVPLIMDLRQVLATFGCEVVEKVTLTMSRLQNLKHGHDQLSELVAMVKGKTMVYKKAFILQCQNLHKAEKEVDLLGDQVDGLLDLLDKTYATLDHYSPILQHYFGVSELLRLIKKELNGGTAQSYIVPDTYIMISCLTEDKNHRCCTNTDVVRGGTMKQLDDDSYVDFCTTLTDDINCTEMNNQHSE